LNKPWTKERSSLGVVEHIARNRSWIISDEFYIY